MFIEELNALHEQSAEGLQAQRLLHALAGSAGRPDINLGQQWLKRVHGGKARQQRLVPAQHSAAWREGGGVRLPLPPPGRSHRVARRG